MTLRNLWGHELYHHETPAEAPAGTPAAPGTGEDAPVVPEATPAEAQTTETSGPPPGPIPYARFKEVNDSLREVRTSYEPYEALEQQGVTADDFQRLTAWEGEYMQDPVGVWIRQAETIEDLPEVVKAAIAEVKAGEAVPKGTPPADGGPPPVGSDGEEGEEGEPPPSWAQGLLERDRIAQEREAADRERAEAEAVSTAFDGLINAWDKLDIEQGFVVVNEAGETVSATPEEAKLAFIASAVTHATSFADTLRTARESFLKTRDSVLSTVVVPGGNGTTVPRPVPGGAGAQGSAPPPRPTSLRQATKAAEAELTRQFPDVGR